jgi:hypothetical protein
VTKMSRQKRESVFGRPRCHTFGVVVLLGLGVEVRVES